MNIDLQKIATFTMQELNLRPKCQTNFRGAALAAMLFMVAVLSSAPAVAEDGGAGGKISLKVSSFERMQQYPPPPPPPRVFIVSAGAGYEMAVITVKVSGSATFDDYKMSAGAFVVDADGTRRIAALSKPFKGGFNPEVWDKQVLVFSIKKDAKLKTLTVAGMTFDLSNIDGNK